MLIGAVMVQSLRDSAIQEATARCALLAQGFASERDRFLTSPRQAVQMLTRHLEDERHLVSGGRAALFAQATRRGRSPRADPQEIAGLAQAFEEMLGRLTQAQGALESRLAETAALLAIAKVV